MNAIDSATLRRAYLASLKLQRRQAALAYKLCGGRLNDPARRKPVTAPKHKQFKENR